MARKKFKMGLKIILPADWDKDPVLGLDTERLVEIKGDVEGTGYLIGSSLILTARHVVDNYISEARTVPVRILGEWRANHSEWRTAKVIWPTTSSSGEVDAALLAISEQTEDVNPVSYILITGMGRLEVYVNGFPNAG